MRRKVKPDAEPAAAESIMTYGAQAALLQQAQAAFLMIYGTVPSHSLAAQVAAEWAQKIAEARSGGKHRG